MTPASVHTLEGNALTERGLLPGSHATGATVLRVLGTSSGFQVVHSEQFNQPDQINNHNEWRAVSRRFVLPGQPRRSSAGAGR